MSFLLFNETTKPNMISLVYRKISSKYIINKICGKLARVRFFNKLGISSGLQNINLQSVCGFQLAFKKKDLYLQCLLYCYYFPKMVLLKYTQKLKIGPHHKQGDHAALKRNLVSQLNSALIWFRRH